MSILRNMCILRKHMNCFKTVNEINPRNRRDPNRLELNDVLRSTKYNKNC